MRHLYGIAHITFLSWIKLASKSERERERERERIYSVRARRMRNGKFRSSVIGSNKWSEYIGDPWSNSFSSSLLLPGYIFILSPRHAHILNTMALSEYGYRIFLRCCCHIWDNVFYLFWNVAPPFLFSAWHLVEDEKWRFGYTSAGEKSQCQLFSFISNRATQSESKKDLGDISEKRERECVCVREKERKREGGKQWGFDLGSVQEDEKPNLHFSWE